MQKKVAVIVTYIVLGILALYGIINSVLMIGNPNNSSQEAVPITIAGMLMFLVIVGLVALYFFVSKRVKQTLIN